MEIFYENKRKYNYRVNGVPYYRKTVTIGGKRRSFYGDGEKDCLAKIEEAKKMAGQGYNLDSKNALVGPTMRSWLFNVKRVDADIKASTLSRYECILRHQVECKDIARVKLSALDSATMQAYVTALWEEDELSGLTIKMAVKVWRMFTKWAVDEGYLIKDPCRNLSLPGKRTKVKREVETFSADERAKIMNTMKETNFWYDSLIKLAFATGMRQGELLALKWSDIYDHMVHVERSTGVVAHVNKDGSKERYREVWDTKTENSVRSIPLLESTELMLHEQYVNQCQYMLKHGLGKSEYVFTDAGGHIIDADTLRKAYTRMLEQAGVPHKKFHAIRHTFATEAIRRGVKVKDLQLIMGHANIDTTYIYVHSDDDSKRSAIETMGAII